MNTLVPIRWSTVRVLAKRRGIPSPTLRKRLERNAVSHRGHVGARLDDVVGCKLGTRWYVSEQEIWPRSRERYSTREAAAILGTSPTALRRMLERNQQHGRAEVGGIIGLKLPSGHWRTRSTDPIYEAA